ncbi:MAG: N-acetyl-gamma-glutamyl-phosphate reductase [Phycisphaerales bacterium]
MPLSNSSRVSVPVAVVGASGYSGAELVSILLGHPSARLAGLFGSARREGNEQAFSDSWPRFRGRLDAVVKPVSIDALVSSGAKAVFLATPHEASVELAPSLLDAGLVVLDLSGGHRFKNGEIYPKYYGFEHKHPEILERTVYGLPELHRDRIAGADMIAVPGCYPTSAILPLAPLVRADAIARDNAGRRRRPIIDSASGVSGAGRTLAQKSLFCEVSLQAYNVFKHRHNPEIDAYAGTPTVFTPHLAAFERGILSTIHVELAEGWTASRIEDVFGSAYAHEPFVRLCGEGVWPAVADVRHTNFCDIGWGFDPEHRHLIIASAIDNLVKGAAGQAVQCFNLRFGLAEDAGLSASKDS